MGRSPTSVLAPRSAPPVASLSALPLGRPCSSPLLCSLISSLGLIYCSWSQLPPKPPSSPVLSLVFSPIGAPDLSLLKSRPCPVCCASSCLALSTTDGGSWPASWCFCSALAARLAPVNSPVHEPGRLHSSGCVLRFARRLLRVLLRLPRQDRSESQLHGSFIFWLPSPADTVSGCSRDHCAKISFCIPSSCLVCRR